MSRSDERAAYMPMSGQDEPIGTQPEMQALLLAMPENAPRVTKTDVRRGQDLLQKYKAAKANLEARIVEDEQWYKARHWEAVRKRAKKNDCGRRGVDEACTGLAAAQKEPEEPSSAWLFNAIATKHADAMDNYPEPAVLPREQSDEKSANVLSEVLPVILANNSFEQVYADNWWEKLKHGTAVYGVFWNSQKENGLGDVDVRMIDLLNIFWEPGVRSIQDSRNVFVVALAGVDVLERRYPKLAGKIKGGEGTIDVKRYQYDDDVDTSDMACVVDWYYKLEGPDGQARLHYVKFVGDELLYASENDPACRDDGFYAHGLYPFVFDTLFPEKDTPVGFGYVAICKDPQLYIDKLSGGILRYTLQAAKPRWFIGSNTGVNEREYLDWANPLVHVEGGLDDTHMRQIQLAPLPSTAFSALQMKIEEMKDTAANRDVNSGGTSHGVTAASAIAALQEAGNKLSRDMIAASYRAYSAIGTLCIELIRQFYDEKRSFRIVAPNGSLEFVDLSNEGIRDQVIGNSPDGSALYRRPVFDLKISAQRRNPFARMEQNERAKELYARGFFNPQRAQEAIIALDMMDFEGIDKIREHVKQGETLFNIVQQQRQQLQEQADLLRRLAGKMGILDPSAPHDAPDAALTGAAPTPPDAAGTVNPDSLARSTMEAHTPMTSYGQRLAERSKPSVDA